MLSIVKNSFVWQFAAGFALGAVGLAAVHAAPVKAAPVPTEMVRR